MKAGLLKRLEDIERQYKLDPLIVLAEVGNKEDTVKMTMRECLKKENTRFIRVIAGSSLEDLDLFLKAIEEEARRHCEGKEGTEE